MHHDREDRKTRHAPKWQFSLRAILLVLTVSAVVIAAALKLNRHFVQRARWTDLSEIVSSEIRAVTTARDPASHIAFLRVTQDVIQQDKLLSVRQREELNGQIDEAIDRYHKAMEASTREQE